MDEITKIEPVINRTKFFVFKLTWVVICLAGLAAVLFMWVNDSVGLIDMFNGLKALIFFGIALSVLLLLPEPKIHPMFKVFIILFVIAMAVVASGVTGQYIDAGPLFLILPAVVIFLEVVVSLTLFGLIEARPKYLNVFMGLALVVAVVAVVFAWGLIAKGLDTGFKNQANGKYFSELRCKAAYGISAGEFKSYCDKITPTNSRWIRYKVRCDEIYPHLATDPNYADPVDPGSGEIPFIRPELYGECAANYDYHFFGKSHYGDGIYDTDHLIRPEFKDPLVCEKAIERKECYMRVIDKTMDYTLCDKFTEPDRGMCYIKVAEVGGDKTMCERVSNEQGHRDSCYRSVASRLRDPVVCELISGNFQYVKDNCLTEAKAPR